MNLYLMITECFQSAIKSLSTSKLRSILTVLGIVIGITSVTVISSLGNGLQQTIMESFEGLGMDRIQVMSEDNTLTVSDAELIAQHENASTVVPYVSVGGMVDDLKEDDDIYLTTNGVTENYINMMSTDLKYGRFLLENDVLNASKVIVIQDVLSEKYFGYENSVGETIRVSYGDFYQDFVVIGIVETAPDSMMFYANYEAEVPYTTLQNIFGLQDNIDGIYVGILDSENVAEMPDEIKNMLVIKNGTDGDDYLIYNLMQQMEEIEKSFDSVILFVNAVASIALLVGSIGIMNIMLVTVTERTREIGIRKALGATKGNIRLQFLIEAVILSIFGGMIGVILGYLAAVLVGANMDVTPAFSPADILGYITICAVIGILSGVYPASKASNLNPIDALRYE